MSYDLASYHHANKLLRAEKLVRLLPLIRSYMTLFTETGQYYEDTGNHLTQESYAGGSTLFSFHRDVMTSTDHAETRTYNFKIPKSRFELPNSQVTSPRLEPPTPIPP